MEYVCFQQLDITASNIKSEYCLLYVHIKHFYSRTDRIVPLLALATGFTHYKITSVSEENKAQSKLTVGIYVFPVCPLISAVKYLLC